MEELMILLCVSALFAREVPEDSILNSSDRSWTIEPTWELGSLAVLQNNIQLGKDGTAFDYVADGGEDNLFAYQRFETNFRYKERHSFVFLYQPLTLETTQEASTDLKFDLVTFSEGTPMEYKYGFDYTRATYMYDVTSSMDSEISFGVGLQMRNATLDFRSADGTLADSNRDIGPVPLVTSRGRFGIDAQRWWGYDMAGAYAPIKYLNGDVSDVVGALLDASVRGGFVFSKGTDVFINLRYVGGGAEGTESEPIDGKDGFVENWIQVVSLSLGVSVY
jgi:hypothetical protein